MKAAEIREMTTEEIRHQLEVAQERLFNLRFQWALNQLKDKNEITRAKRDIARLKTILRERELKGEE